MRTILHNLEEKLYVTHTVEGRTYVYRAVETRRSVAVRATQQIIDRFCGGSAVELLIGLVDSQVLKPRQLVLIDMGAFQEGYASDMTRMLFLGAPGAQVKRLYRAVLEAQLAAIDAVRPGVTTARVDRQARNVLKAYKLDRAFVHSTGHGLGLEIHELPRIGKKDKTPLAAGMAITIEPGVY